MMSESPALHIDWESGEGRIHVGHQLTQSPARFRYDVLADWKGEIDHMLRAVERELHPQRPAEQLEDQRTQNRRRRVLCERLSGANIRMAEPLVNGDVLLHLADGSTVVVFARHEDVKFDVIDTPQRARAYAQRAGTGDYYLREDAP